MCDVCGEQVAPEEVTYLRYVLVNSIPVLFTPDSMITIEGHNGCLSSVVEAMPS